MDPFGDGNISSLINFFGQPIVALLIGAWCRVYAAQEADFRDALIQGMGRTGHHVGYHNHHHHRAGGAFGRVLQDSNIASVVENNPVRNKLGDLAPHPDGSCLKTAQGSGTVAIITTAGIMAPLMESFGLD